MLRKIITILLFCVFTLSISAAPKKKTVLKKDIAQAKAYLKAGNNLERAEQLMAKHLQDSANRTNERLWLIMFDAVRKQYEQANMKLYLKQKYDTAAFFNITKRMFTILETFDSIDTMPNEEGEVKPEYRKKHAEFLDQHRTNLFNGGAYFVGKQRFQDAYDYFNLYLDCARQPLFSSYNYDENDPRMPETAYWTVYCGYKLQDAQATLQHIDLALKDSAHYSLLLQYLADTHKLEKDTAKYVETLREGFAKYPTFPYFFPRLVEHEAAQGNWNEVLTIADTAIAADTTRAFYRLVRTTALLNLRQYDTCIAESDALIARNDSLSIAWYNAGMACFNQAVEIDKNVKVTAKQKQKMHKKYQRARHYIERFRALAPDRQDRWALPLYTIYLNLNMGAQFDEINRLIRSK